MNAKLKGRLLVVTTSPMSEETHTELNVEPGAYVEFLVGFMYELEGMGFEEWKSMNTPMGELHCYKRSVKFGPSYRSEYVNLITEKV